MIRWLLAPAIARWLWNLECARRVAELLVEKVEFASLSARLDGLTTEWNNLSAAAYATCGEYGSDGHGEKQAAITKVFEPVVAAHTKAIQARAIAARSFESELRTPAAESSEVK